MPLEGLLALVERLRERIDAHGATLRGNEALTRSALIDPLLRELGWDTSDPHMVMPEYKLGNGRADYALLSNGSPMIILEAKSLESPLQNAVEQGVHYCLMQGTKYFSATNGRRWEVYDTLREAKIDEKRVASFDLKGPSAAEACLQALSLWRPSVISGRVRPGEAPVVGLLNDTPSTTGSRPIVDSVVQPPLDDEPGWEPLSTLEPNPGARPLSPSEIVFPDNSRMRITAWADVTAETVHWLTENNFLTAAHCPIQYGRNRLVLTASPALPNGQPVKRFKKINSLYLNRNFNSRNQVLNSRLIIERASQNPAQFKVRFP